jgi:hypothetical protein
MIIEQHQEDLQDVCGWINANSIEDIETRFEKISIEIFLKQIKEMESTYDEFPDDKARTTIIYNALKNGESIKPIYIEEGDEFLFVLEGRHRMVAFMWAKIPEIEVCFCKLKPA